ncbi:MAG: hypothetical protein PHP75_06395, partial [Methylacidiphilaceae bacterium]|nr:hypothetical protein [Candidatus Methylacidiphilaceae bacterium]
PECEEPGRKRGRTGDPPQGSCPIPIAVSHMPAESATLSCGALASLSRKAHSYDHARMKSFWVTLKTDCFGSFVRLFAVRSG